MRARDALINSYSPTYALGHRARFLQLLEEAEADARAKGLAKAVGRLRAIPVTCTALTGPVWYGTGWNEAITTLEEIADYQKPDDEEYPGELQRLRARMRELRAAALRNEDMARVQQILIDHATYEAKATSEGEVAS